MQLNFLNKYLECRKRSINLCETLNIEDFVVQPTCDVSPPKWHLAHTTWFFEELFLIPFFKKYKIYNEKFRILFNSYYKALGPHINQAERGTLSRPTVSEIFKYRSYVDEQVQNFIMYDGLSTHAAKFIFEIGIQHEQQHQELILMDVKYILSANILETAYLKHEIPQAKVTEATWLEFKEGLYEVGYNGDGFSYDNETPRHKTYLYPFAMSSTLVTNKDYLEFIESKSYLKPKYWLSLGWDWVQTHSVNSPLYWFKKEGEWFEYTLHGIKLLDLHAPLVHISYFEADAFARWKGFRLPTEQEFEVYLELQSASENENQLDFLHPINAAANRNQVWCWTKSAYASYPGFKQFQGAVEEYNAKFMCNQFVLKSGSVVTPKEHYRDTYRNFFLPHQRWMFAGIRLARDLI